jgi:hypothetical protein
VVYEPVMGSPRWADHPPDATTTARTFKSLRWIYEGEDAVTVTNTMGAAELARKYLESPAGSDLLGEMVKMAAELLMDADVDVLCNASYGERTEARVNSRNGHRERRWDTRAGVPSRRSSRSSARPTSRASRRVASTTS